MIIIYRNKQQLFVLMTHNIVRLYEHFISLFSKMSRGHFKVLKIKEVFLPKGFQCI